MEKLVTDKLKTLLINLKKISDVGDKDIVKKAWKYMKKYIKIKDLIRKDSLEKMLNHVMMINI